MNAFVVTESATDELFASWLLGDIVARKGITTKAASGKSSALSLATSLAVRGNAVALLVDADNLDPIVVKSQKDYYAHELKRFGPPDCTFVCMVVPTLEAVVFSNKTFIEEVVGRRLRAGEKFEARYAPQAVLAKLLHVSGHPLAAFMDRVSDQDSLPLRKHPEIKGLCEFLEKLPVPTLS